MIERLLAADGALAREELEHAQRLFGQVVEADPRNAIAVVGLARVAARRGDVDGARDLAARALEIDPDEAAAARLLRELDVAPKRASPPLKPATAPATAPRSSLIDRLLGWLGLGRRA